MSVKFLAPFVLLLSCFAGAQQITLGPFNQPPVDPKNCVVDKNGQTTMCFAKDGVHVSIAGQSFGGSLCDSTNPACQGPQGDPGVKGDKGDQGIQGIQGIQGVKGDPGVPGVVAGCKLVYNNQCPKGSGVNQNGCVATIVSVVCQ